MVSKKKNKGNIQTFGLLADITGTLPALVQDWH
jgi:hypothetical protein